MRTTKIEELTEYQKSIIKNNKLRIDSTPKLIADFNPKHQYPIHYLNLKLNYSLGYKISNISKIVKFKQESFLSDYMKKIQSTETILRMNFKTHTSNYT